MSMRIKDYWRILCMAVFCALTLSACGDDEDDPLPVDEEWRALNDEAFQKQSQVEGYERIESQSNAGYILYKVLKTGDSDETIYYTSKVKIFYRGTFIDGTVFDSRMFEDGEPYAGEDGEGANVYDFVDGFTTALQYMHPGDRWEIWIPQQLGYGVAGSTRGEVTIQPYSTLIFDVEVVEITEQ